MLSHLPESETAVPAHAFVTAWHHGCVLGRHQTDYALVVLLALLGYPEDYDDELLLSKGSLMGRLGSILLRLPTSILNLSGFCILQKSRLKLLLFFDGVRRNLRWRCYYWSWCLSYHFLRSNEILLDSPVMPSLLLFPQLRLCFSPSFELIVHAEKE